MAKTFFLDVYGKSDSFDGKSDRSGGGNAALRGGKSARHCHTAATELRTDLNGT
jgi:hypothetical protein